MESRFKDWDELTLMLEYIRQTENFKADLNTGWSIIEIDELEILLRHRQRERLLGGLINDKKRQS